MKLTTYFALATGIAEAFALSLPRSHNSLVKRNNNNWAGSVLMDNNKYSYVTGMFEVPQLVNPEAGAAIAIWVGIGGALNDPKGAILQTGITIDNNNNIRAWHEWYDEPSIPFVADLAIQPGHKLIATVQVTGSTSGAATLTNTSNGRRAEYKYDNKPKLELTQKSAEWIIEAVTDQGVRRPIPNFQTVTFTEARAFTKTGIEKLAVDGRMHDLYFDGAVRTNCHKTKFDLQCDFEGYVPQTPPNQVFDGVSNTTPNEP